MELGIQTHSILISGLIIGLSIAVGVLFLFWWQNKSPELTFTLNYRINDGADLHSDDNNAGEKVYADFVIYIFNQSKSYLKCIDINWNSKVGKPISLSSAGLLNLEAEQNSQKIYRTAFHNSDHLPYPEFLKTISAQYEKKHSITVTYINTENKIVSRTVRVKAVYFPAEGALESGPPKFKYHK